MSGGILFRGNITAAAVWKGHSRPLVRCMSSVPAERKADWAPRIISEHTFPQVDIQKLRRGTGGRASFNGLIVTVFGGTGFLGTHVVQRLARIGTQVIIPYRCEPYYTKHLKLHGDLGQILFLPYTIRDEEAVRVALKHSNVVVNLVGRDSETPNFGFEEIHCEWPRTLTRLAREEGVRRLVHVSALNSTPNPVPVYVKGGSKWLKTKYWGEQIVREEFPDATIFRPADIYGMTDLYLWYYCFFHRRCWRKLPIHNGGYDIYKTPISAQDVAQAIVNSITDDEAIGNTYDAAGPRRYELRILMQYLQDVTNRTELNGHKITNLRWDFWLRARLAYWDRYSKVWSRNRLALSWEKIERETYSDEEIKNGLTQLGIRLQCLEDNWPYLLALFTWNNSYRGDPGETKVFDPNPPFTLNN